MTTIRQHLQRFLSKTQQNDSNMARKWEKTELEEAEVRKKDAEEKQKLEEKKLEYKAHLQKSIEKTYLDAFFSRFFEHDLKRIEAEIENENFAKENNFERWRTTNTGSRYIPTVTHQVTNFGDYRPSGLSLTDAYASKVTSAFVKDNPDVLAQWNSFDVLKRCQTVAKHLNSIANNNEDRFFSCEFYDNSSMDYSSIAKLHFYRSIANN